MSYVPEQARRLQQQKREIRGRLLAALNAKQPMLMTEVHQVTGYDRLGSSCNLITELIRDGLAFRCRFRINRERGAAEAYIFSDRVQFEQFTAAQKKLAAARLDRYRKAYEDRLKAKRAANREQQKAARDAAFAERRRQIEERKAQRALAKAQAEADRQKRKQEAANTVRVKPARKARGSGKRNYDNAMSEILRKRRAAEDRDPKPAADPFDVDYSKAKVTKLPTPPARFAVGELLPEQKFFSGQKPNTYILEFSSCAAKAAGRKDEAVPA